MISTLFVHGAVALVVLVIANRSGRSVQTKIRRRNNIATAVFIALLLLTIPGPVQDSAAGTPLLVLTVVTGIGVAVLLALASLRIGNASTKSAGKP